jgi:hypothetical protein
MRLSRLRFQRRPFQRRPFQRRLARLRLKWLQLTGLRWNGLRWNVRSAGRFQSRVPLQGWLPSPIASRAVQRPLGVGPSRLPVERVVSRAGA